MDSEAVCSLGSSYLTLLHCSPRPSYSSLVRHQSILLYSSTDCDASANFAKEGPFAQVPEKHPYKIVTARNEAVIVVEIEEEKQAPEWMQKLDMMLKGCTANRIRHITFWKPSTAVWRWFAETGVKQLVDILTSTSSRVIHINLLAPDKPYYDLVYKSLSDLGHLPPRPISGILINEESLLRSFFTAYKCHVCKRLSQKAIFTDERFVCELCEENLSKRQAPPSLGLELIQKVVDRTGFTCRCGLRVTIGDVASHSVVCSKREWFCTEHMCTSPSSEVFFDHLVTAHFERLVANLDKLLT